MAGFVQSIGHLGPKSHACLDCFLFQGLALSTSEAEVFTVSVRVAGTRSALLLLHKPAPLLVRAPSRSQGPLGQPRSVADSSGGFAQWEFHLPFFKAFNWFLCFFLNYFCNFFFPPSLLIDSDIFERSQ